MDVQNRPRFLYIFFSAPGGGPSIGKQSAEITNLLKAWGGGDDAALGRLAEHVYPELRLIARQHMKNEAKDNSSRPPHWSTKSTSAWWT